MRSWTIDRIVAGLPPTHTEALSLHLEVKRRWLEGCPGLPSARRRSTLSTACQQKKHSLLKAKCDDACAPHSIPLAQVAATSNVWTVISDTACSWTFCLQSRPAPTILHMPAEANRSQNPTEAKNHERTDTQRKNLIHGGQNLIHRGKNLIHGGENLTHGGENLIHGGQNPATRMRKSDTQRTKSDTRRTKSDTSCYTEEKI